jgi:hypothetical protein
MNAGGLSARLNALCRELAATAPTALASLGGELSARLDGPLLVALAGRTKAGKSTLLNALVGERVAPTDMSECTRFVTWYRDGPDYLATMVGEDGAATRLAFDRIDGRARIGLPEPIPADFSEITVSLPSRRLRRVCLADTPGFDSADPQVGARTRRLVERSEASNLAPRVDAVVYLLRYAHTADVAFLDVFDQSGVPGSPIGAVGVLSRADELLGGGPDAMEAASRVAVSLSGEPQLRSLLGAIIPVSGLLAETAATLTEREFAWLRSALAGEPEGVRRSLLSIDRFCDAGNEELPLAAREHLASRFGLFGLRWAAGQLAAGRAKDSAAFAAGLSAISGLDHLRDVLEQRFDTRARRLVAQSVLATLEAAAARFSESEPRAAGQLRVELERIRAGAHELAELRLLEAALTGELTLSPDETTEVERIVEDASPLRRLGLGEGAAIAEAKAAAAARVGQWRERAESPLAMPSERELLEIAARSYEGIYAELVALESPAR